MKQSKGLAVVGFVVVFWVFAVFPADITASVECLTQAPTADYQMLSSGGYGQQNFATNKGNREYVEEDQEQTKMSNAGLAENTSDVEEEPPADEPPEDESPEDEPPADEPPEDESPEDEPPADEPPEDESPEDEPPADEPPEDEPSE
jgi:hypothetical protein